MAWNGELKGALSVGFSEMRRVTDDDLRTRIILACDAYNAMITTRPYREAMSTEHATAELRAKSGTQFDPRVVGALLERLGAVSEPASEASAS